MHLDESKLLIALVLQNFAEESDLVVLFQICSDTVDQNAGPLNNESLEPVLLVKVGVHELLHGLHGQSTLSALNIVLDLLLVHVINYIL